MSAPTTESGAERVPAGDVAKLVEELSTVACLIEEWLFNGATGEDTARRIMELPPLADTQAALAAQIAGHRHSAKEATMLLIERKERAKERDRIVAAGEDLVAALARYGFPMSDEAWRNTGDAAPVNRQASVEARTLHHAATAFFLAISGGKS